MRDIVLQRLNALKQFEGGFSKDDGKWGHVYIDSSVAKGVHVSEVDFSKLPDAELLNVFMFIMSHDKMS